jgi:protein O-GlcNAc transferase
MLKGKHSLTVNNGKQKKANEYISQGASVFSNGDVEGAIKLFRKALLYNPGSTAANFNLGLCYQRVGLEEKAIKHFSKVLVVEPHDFEALNNLGNLYLNKGKVKEAEAAFLKVVTINPKLAEGYYNLGVVYQRLGDNQKALKYYQKSSQLNPNNEKLYNNLAVCYKRLGKTEKAIEIFKKALKVNPDLVIALTNLAALLMFQKPREAQEYLKRAVTIDPDNIEVQYNLGVAYQTVGMHLEAARAYNKVIDLNPGFVQAYGQLFHKLKLMADWKGMQKLLPLMVKLSNKALKKGELPPETPYISVSTFQNLSRNLKVAKAWSTFDENNVALFALGKSKRPLRKKGKMISIGYLSNDFRDHATSHLILGLLRLHDQDKFKIYTYSYGSSESNKYTTLTKKYVYKFRDIVSVSDIVAAEQIRKDGIDILVDLKGHTSGCRLGILALRPAPIQVTWLGFPGTTGSSFIDYMITDKVVTPKSEAKYYSEKLVYLPNSYQPNDNLQTVSNKVITRSDMRLPKKAFVFSSFNQSFKIEVDAFDLWMRLLKKVPGSVLWLWENNPQSKQNLIIEAKKRGIQSSRLVFSESVAKDIHLKRLGLADLALDTFTYNGHTTTSDCLWAGVPVVTLKGKHFASRVSASLLTAIGLPELITRSSKEYYALAYKLATNPKTLAEIRLKLENNRLAKPLFNTPEFTLNLEEAYRRMWTLYKKGKKPTTIDIATKVK